MRVELKDIASATKRLADGRRVRYWYAWRGGPRLEGEPGTPAFHASYNAAIATLSRPDPRKLFALISEFRQSADYQGLGRASRRSYGAYLKLIEEEFGDMPIAGLARPEARGDFKEWRDGFAATPRKADYLWATLARVLAFAKDRGRIPVNPCERGGRLYASDRVDKVWGEAEIGRIIAAAPPHIAPAIVLALWTGQRQGDLLRLAWSAYDGRYIKLRQGKGGRGVTIPVGKPLKDVLDAMPRLATQILTTLRPTAKGRPERRAWTSDGFRASWSAAIARAGLAAADLTFHDFRGTAVTRLALAGATEAEIATITGHSLETVRHILDKHYLSRDVRLAESAIRKLVRHERRGLQRAAKPL